MTVLRSSEHLDTHAAANIAPYFGPITPQITGMANAVLNEMALDTFDTRVTELGEIVARSPLPTRR